MNLREFRRWDVIIAVLVIALVGIWLMLSPAGHDADDEENGRIADETAETLELSDAQRHHAAIETAVIRPRATEQVITRYAEVTVAAGHVANVAAGVAAMVVELQAAEGDRVETGTALATLESSEFAGLQSNFLNARDMLELTAKAFQREKRLLDQGVTSEEAYLESRQRWQEATIGLGNSEEALRALSIDPAGIDTGAVGKYVVRAPLSGAVVGRSIDLGQRVQADSPMFVIADLSRLWVEVQLFPDDLGAVATGGAATVRASPDGPYVTGRVDRIVPQLDETTRTAFAIVAVANDPDAAGALYPGEFVIAELPLKSSGTGMVVPESALVQDADGNWQVFEETRRNTFLPRRVVVEWRIAGGVVVDGLSAGITVVTGGAFFLRSELEKGSLVDDD